jgi:putative intracellular protease/amidase/uncharacterized protein (DUF952 family)
VRWLHHITTATELGDAFAPESLTREGFVHCSLRGAVRESARLYFASTSPEQLRVLRIDPRRLDAPVRFDDTPRGPMPHVYGAIPRDAIAEVIPLDAVDLAPDEVSGTRFAIVGFARMTLLDLVGVYDPLARIGSMGVDPSSSVEIVSATAEPWQGGGARLVPSRVQPELSEFDVVVLAGGPETRKLRDDPEVLSWLDRFPHNRLIASVCTGALLLGAAGRLRGKRATTHHLQLDALAAYGTAAVLEERVVDEGQLVTAGGVTAALDLGLHLVARLYGEAARQRIAAQMEHPGAAAEPA